MLKAEPIMETTGSSQSSGEIKEIEPPRPQPVQPTPNSDVIPPEYLQDQTPQDNQSGNRKEVSICPDSGLLAGPNCPAPVLVGFDISAGDKPPERYCDIHTGSAQPAAPKPNQTQTPKPKPGAKKVTLPVCAITHMLATENCPVVVNMTFDEKDAPSQTCTRHGRR